MKVFIHFLKTLVATLCLGMGFQHAGAQTVYRCGATYSQTPCPGAVAFDANDSRTEAQRQDAQKAAAREVRSAKDMEETRLRRERQLAAQDAAARKAENKRASTESPEATDTSAPRHVKKKRSGKEPEFFTAAGPKPADKKTPKP